MSADESKRLVLGFIEDLSNGNIKAVEAAFAEDASWWLPGSLPVSGTFKGKKAIFEDFFGKAFPYFEPDSMSIQVKSAIAEDDAVAVEWIARASGPVEPCSPTSPPRLLKRCPVEGVWTRPVQTA